MAALQVQCPICKAYLDATGERVGIDSEANTVTMVLDVSKLQEHVRVCTKVPEPKALRPRFTFKDIAPVFIVAGRRACMGCGATNGQCLRQLEQQRPAISKGQTHGACCGMCAEGNTHPAVAGDVPCATWGLTHGATN